MTRSNPHEICDLVIRHLENSLDYCRFGLLLRRDGASKMTVFSRSKDTPDEGTKKSEIARINALVRSTSNGVLEQVARSGRPIVVPEVSLHEGYVSANPGTLSEACFPVVADGRCLGVFDCEAASSHKFDWGDYTLLSAITAQLSQLLLRNWALVEDTLAAHEAL